MFETVFVRNRLEFGRLVFRHRCNYINTFCTSMCLTFKVAGFNSNKNYLVFDSNTLKLVSVMRFALIEYGIGCIVTE